MRVKLRPSARLAPVARGLYCSQAGESFVLAGPRALYEAVDAQLAGLSNGIDLEELVAASGAASRPVWQHVLRTLLAHDVLIDLDAVSAPPDADHAARYRDVLAWLESTDADPYAAFARLRAATVAVVGTGPAADAARRSLIRYGVGTVTGSVTGADLAVVVNGAPEPGVRTLAVRAAADHALVGPAGPAMTALAERVATAVAADRTLVAAAPLSSVLAGSIAAHLALRLLAGQPVPADATVLHGRELATDTVALPVPGAATPGSHERLDALAEPEPVPDPADAQRRANLVAARWAGPVRWGADLDLPQLPFALVTATGDDGRTITGYGLNRAAAAVNAALSVLRSAHGAAGLTSTRWLLDGGLRRSAAALLAGDAERAIGWDEVGNGDTRSVWNLLHEYFGQPVELALRRAPGSTWVLVTVTDARTGETLAGQWGASVEHAARLALVAAAAAAQLQAATGSAGSLDLIGTAALETASGRAVRVAAAEAGAVTGERVTWDPVLGAAPLCWGRVWPA